MLLLRFRGPKASSDFQETASTDVPVVGTANNTPKAVENQVFYVATDGDDSGPGSIDQPWRTIQHAAETLVAGETVYIRGGVYSEHVSTVRYGDPVAGYIVFSAYPDERPVVDGAGVTNGDTGFSVSHSYIKLIGLELCNWETGVWMEDCGHVEISDCEVHDVYFGIGVADGAHDFELNWVEIHDFTLYGFDASPSGGADCCNGIFNDCTAHTCRDPNQNVDGFALGHGDQHGFVFNRCEVYDVYDGFDICACDTMLSRCSAHGCGNSGYKIWEDNVTLVNCLSYHNEVTNLELDWDGEPGTTTLRNCHFVDSQIYNIWIENSADQLHMYNCILAGGDNIGLAFEQMGVENYRGDYNIFHNDDAERIIVVGYEDEFSLDQIVAGDWATYSGQDKHSLVSFDPESELFEDLNEWDLRFVEGSIAIDVGTPDYAPPVDYDGVSRPQGEGYDIGAYEYLCDAQAPRISNFSILFASNQVRMIYPSDTSDKPLNRSSAMVSDWSASAYVSTKLENFSEGLDTDDSFVNQTTGNPRGDLGVGIVSFGGPIVNVPVYHYELNKIAPVTWRGVPGAAGEGEPWAQWYLANGYAVTETAVETSESLDLFLIEVFEDADGRYVFLAYGIGWKGTYAAGKYFEKEVYPNLASYPYSWIIARWEDTNGDGFVNAPGDGDTYTMLAYESPPTTEKISLWDLGSGPHLRGANVYQRRVYPELDGPDFMGPGPVGPPYTQEDFDRLATLGANYVVISHPGLFTENPPYTLDQDIQNNLDELLDMIAEADMFAVISFRTGPGRSEFTFMLEDVGDWFDESYLNDAVWRDQAAQDAWVTMWRYTAERYRENPIIVGYNLMVEPNANEVWLDIWDPEEFYADYGDTLYDWNQLHPRITTAIREVDADTPILIGGMSYSAVEWLPYLQPTGDPRTVYTVHQYEPFRYTHQSWKSQDCTYPGIFDTDWDGVDDPFNRVWLENLLSTVGTFAATHGVPVAVDEFGVMRWEPGAADFMDDQMELFEQQGVNYALWVWDPSWEPWAEEVDAFNFRHGPDPQNHVDVASSDLIEVIVKHWGFNAIRPSSVTFTRKRESKMTWSSVDDFVYQLQNIDPITIGNTKFDLVIIDYSQDGSEENRFTADEISALKNSPGGPKLVLAYMSIGEAENYRWYWEYDWDLDDDGDPDHGAPSWLGPSNPDWPGNYKVKYWVKDWQSIVYGSSTSYLDKIIEAGFDGVYLDIIDAYEYWGIDGESGLNRETAEQEMVDFVMAIANYARTTKGMVNFGIFPQNGEALSHHSDYVQVVDGIGKEDTWYDDNTPQPSSYTNEVISHLDAFRKAEKLVLVIDYVTDRNLINDFYSKAEAKGYVPYATVRDLDTITINPGHDPD